MPQAPGLIPALNYARWHICFGGAKLNWPTATALNIGRRYRDFPDRPVPDLMTSSDS